LQAKWGRRRGVLDQLGLINCAHVKKAGEIVFPVFREDMPSLFGGLVAKLESLLAILNHCLWTMTVS
jgi:hypothetical protein